MSSNKIEQVLQQVLQDGHLTPAIKAELERICNSASEWSIEEQMSLDRLMGVLYNEDTSKWSIEEYTFLNHLAAALSNAEEDFIRDDRASAYVAKKANSP